VIEHVESSLRHEEGLRSGFKARSELLKRLQELEDENSALRKENRMPKLALEKLDDELRGYRARPFLDEGFRGLRGFERRLIDLLRSRKTVKGEEVLDLLGIDPGDTDLTRAVHQQLKVLEAYGLVEVLPDGWRWVR